MADFDFNQLMENPMFNMGLGLLAQPRRAPIGQGLLAGMQSANTQGLLGAKRRKEEKEEMQRLAQEQFFAGITPEDIPNVYQKMLNVPGLGQDALKGLAKDPRKIVYQQDAEGNIVALPETMPASGEVSPIMTGVRGMAKGREKPWYVDTDDTGKPTGINPLFREFELAKAKTGGGASPFYQFMSTPQGIAIGNARTGGISMGGIDGKPIMRADSDPALQGEIAGAKAAGQAKAKRDTNMTGLGSIITEAEQLLSGKSGKALPTGSTIGTGVDIAAGMIGYSPGGAEEAQALKAIGGALTSKMPRMEGPQSDKDTQLYREMAAVVGDSTIPRSRRLTALKKVKEIWGKYEPTHNSGGWGIRRLP